MEGLKLSKIPRTHAVLFKSRLEKIWPWPWWTGVGLLVASHGSPPLLPTVFVIVSMLTIATCVYVYNDVMDLEMDKLNPEKLNRPLPSGKVSKKEAISIVYLNGFVGIALSLFINIETFLLCAIYIVLFLAYSNPHIRLKKKFLLKEVTLSMGCLLSTFIGGMAAGTISASVIFSGVFLFVFGILGSAAFADVPDITEDKKYGVKTLAMVLGWKTRIEMVILFVLVIMTLTPLTYVQLGLNIVFPIMVVASCFLFLRFLFTLLNRFERSTHMRATYIAFTFSMLVQIALILGSLQILV